MKKNNMTKEHPFLENLTQQIRGGEMNLSRIIMDIDIRDRIRELIDAIDNNEDTRALRKIREEAMRKMEEVVKATI